MPKASKLLRKWIIIFACSHAAAYLVSFLQTKWIVSEVRKKKEGDW